MSVDVCGAGVIRNIIRRKKSGLYYPSCCLLRPFSSKLGSSPPSLPSSTTCRYSSANIEGNGLLRNNPSEGAVAVRTSANENDDLLHLVNLYPPHILAKAVRSRELDLKRAASLASSLQLSSSSSSELDELNQLLSPYRNGVSFNGINRLEDSSTDLNNDINVDFTKPLNRRDLSLIKNILLNIPRQIDNPSVKPDRRASVVIPLCNDDGVPSILFERRSNTVRTHKSQVCFPGGMFDDEHDKTIVQTSLREMQEELGIPSKNTEVLGVLRCNWHEVSDFTGIAITPVIGYIGEIKDIRFNVNSDEVSEYFTVKVESLLDEKKWVRRSFSPPIFTGAPDKVIWGLTAYLLDRFISGVLARCTGGKNI